MARTVVDPYTTMANAIQQAISTEFDDIQYLTVVHDRIHESLGADGTTWIGISPDTQDSSGIEMSMDVLIQFYGPFFPEVEPTQQIDPRDITYKAERLRHALSDIRTLGQAEVWFFDVVETRYPNDATGNKTRFEMVVTGRGNNSAYLRETG